jgi:hypothetical protein
MNAITHWHTDPSFGRSTAARTGDQIAAPIGGTARVLLTSVVTKRDAEIMAGTF